MTEPKMHVRKDDTVLVLSGKDKGKQGRVLVSIPKQRRVIVEDINMVKKHTRPSATNPSGGILETEAPIKIDKLQVVCPSCKEATRVGRKKDENNRSYRYCKKCGKSLDK